VYLLIDFDKSGKLTDLVKHITMHIFFTFVFVLALLNLSMGEIVDEAKVCELLTELIEETVKTDGWALESSIRAYCIKECGNAVSCDDYITYDASAAWSSIRAKVEAFDSKTFAGDTEVIDDKILDAWYMIGQMFIPVLIGYLPVVLSSFKVRNVYIVTLFSVAYVWFGFIGFGSYIIMVHNIVLACLTLTSSSAVIGDTFWGLVGFAVAFGTMFFDDWKVHVLCCLCVSAGYVTFVYFAFVAKSNNKHSSALVLLLQMFCMNGLFIKIVNSYAMRTSTSITVWLGFNAVFPSGVSSYFFKNAGGLALRLASKYLEYKVEVWISAFVAQWICCFCFRALLGAFYISKLRYRVDIETVLNGFWVYLSDFFGPFRVVSRVIFGHEKRTGRRMWYGIIGLALLWYEFSGAREVFVLRLFCSVMDIMFGENQYSRTTHYLDFNVDFMQVAFPQNGSLPWMSLDLLTTIGKHVHEITVQKPRGVVRGVCVALKSGGRSMLYTVKHVARDARMIMVNGAKYSTPTFEDVTRASDPIVAMKFDQVDLPSVELLRLCEVDDITALAVLTSDLDGEPKVNIIPDFSFYDGSIHAAVNLAKGDSGSPCFSIMRDGNVRLCGVVSAGNPRRGGGNFVASCLADNFEEINSSDESEDGTRLQGIANFNSIRRRFGENHDGHEIMHRNNLNKYITDNRDALSRLRSWSVLPTWDDFDEHSCNDDLADALNIGVKHVTFVEGPPNIDEGSKPREANANRDRKKKQKSRAAQKRQLDRDLSVLRAAKAMLSAAYVDDDARNIFEGLSRGDVPEMTNGDICKYEDGNWLYES